MTVQKVGLQLVAEDADKFVQAMNNAANAQNNFQNTLSNQGRTVAVSRDEAGFWSNAWTGAAEQVGGTIVEAFLKASGAVVNFVKDAPMMAAELEDKMNWYGAVSGATDDQVKSMQELVLLLGKELPVSTMETADAAVELAKGGLSQATLEAGGLRDTLNFAASANLGLEQAATVVVKQLGTFTSVTATAEEQASFMAQSMDLMTKAANASTLDVAELSLGLTEAGGTAKAIGLDYESFVTTMGVLSPAFSSASTAGTSFKNFLLRLTPSSKDAFEQMKSLGLVTESAGKMMDYLKTMGLEPVSDNVEDLKKQINSYLREDLGFKDTQIEKVFRELYQNNFYDAEGNLKGMAEVSQLLQDATKDLSNEERSYTFNKIFQNEAMNTAIQLADGGAVAYDMFAQKMAEANGVSAQAEEIQQGLDFEMEQFQGTMEALQLTVGTIFIPIMTQAYNLLNRITATALDVANAILGDEEAFFNLSPVMQEVVLFGKDIAKVFGDFYNALLSDDLVTQTESFFALSQPLQNIVHWVRAVIDWFNMLPENIVKASIMVAPFVFQLQSLWSWFMEITNGGQLFTDMLNYAIEIGTAFWNYLMTLGPAFDPLLVAFEIIAASGKRMWDMITKAFGGVNEQIGETNNTWLPAITSTIELIVSIIAAAILLIVNIVESLVYDITRFWESYGDVIVFTVKWVIDEIIFLWTFLSKTVNAIIGIIINLINGDLKGAFNVFTDWLNDIAIAIYNFAKNMASNLLTYLANRFPQFKEQFLAVWDFAKLAKDMIVGFIDGFVKEQSKALNAISKFGVELLKVLKNALGIKSPSKEMYDIGVNLGEGLILGISSKIPEIKKLMDNISSSVILNPYAIPNNNSQYVYQNTYNNSYNLGVQTRASATETIQSFTMMKAMI